MYERKGVKGVSVVHAGIAEERKAKETKGIGINTKGTEAGSAEDTERRSRIQNGFAGAHSRIHGL